MKICPKCKVQKDFSDFHTQKGKKDGRSSHCKKCRKKYQVNYAASEKRKAVIFRYRHTEKYKEQQRRYTTGTGREKQKGYRLWYRFGITLERYKEMEREQADSCAICGVHSSALKTSLNVDHNHENGKVRGLLCAKCNQGLGLFKDNPVLFGRAIDYLKRYS
jgi:hypothetical protein